MRLYIDYPPTRAGKTAWNRRFGLNAYYAGKHFQARKRDAEELHGRARAAMKRARIRREMIRGPWRSASAGTTGWMSTTMPSWGKPSWTP